MAWHGNGDDEGGGGAILEGGVIKYCGCVKIVCPKTPPNFILRDQANGTLFLRLGKGSTKTR